MKATLCDICGKPLSREEIADERRGTFVGARTGPDVVVSLAIHRSGDLARAPLDVCWNCQRLAATKLLAYMEEKP
jgi:hypothetical protein